MSTEIAPISEVERDALCELANVAMARAATSIRRMVGRQILLSVPTCDILAPEAAAERLAKPDNPHLVAVRQDFSGDPADTFRHAPTGPFQKVSFGRLIPRFQATFFGHHL